MAQWYVIRGDQERGPFDDSQLKELASSGKLKTDHLIRRDGSQRKYLTKNVKGLFPVSPSQTETETEPAPLQNAKADSNGKGIESEIDPIPVQPEVPNEGQEDPSNAETVNLREHIWPEGLFRQANQGSSMPPPQVISDPNSLMADTNGQPSANDVSSKIPAIISSLITVMILCWLFSVPTVSTLLFWYWGLGCLLSPALMYHTSMTGQSWQISAEVALRTLIFFLGGFLGLLFIGIIGIDLFLGRFLLDIGLSLDEDTKKTIGFVIGSAPVAFLPRNWEILLLIASVLGIIVGKIGIQAASDGRACHRCRGTRYCYPCRGNGCPQCMFTGQCQSCLGTGLG
jgi:hypothetical protein